MGLVQKFKDATRRGKAVQVTQELANNLFVNPLCSDYENVFAQVQPLINDMMMVRPFGVGSNGGRLTPNRTPELNVLNSPNSSMGYMEFVRQMFTNWLTEDELDIRVHFEGKKVVGYTILQPSSKVYTGNGNYYFQVKNSDGVYENVSRDEVMTLMFSRSPKNLQRGISPATAIRAWAQTEDVLAQYERAYIENGAIPASITFIRASSQDKFNAVRKELEGNLRGAKNHGKTIYVWRQFNNDTGESLDQVEVKTIQGNNSTLAIKELSDIINDHLNKAYGVSNFILGDDSSAKYDNAELSDYQFIKRRVFPALAAFWDQFQFELDRVTGGLGYGINFEIELPDLTERLKVRAETNRIRTETLRELIQAGSMPSAAVKALDLSNDWLDVARGMYSRTLSAIAVDKINNLSKIAKTRPNITPCSCEQVHLSATTTATSQYAGSVARDELPQMTEDERRIYNALVAMAERIFAETPNIQIDDVVAEISEVLNNRAEIGGVEAGEAVTRLLKDKEIIAGIKSELENLQISGTLKDRITERTSELVKNYGQRAQGILDNALANPEGKSASEIKKELAPMFTRETMWQADRIARTETVYAYKSGRLDEDQRINKKYDLHMKIKWHCRHDGDTCDTCAAMDGKTVDVGEAFVDHLDLPAGTVLVNGHELDEDMTIGWEHNVWNDGGKIPSPHPNCRCYYTEIVEAN